MTHVPVQCEDTDKISVECQDDQFGFHAQVVFEEKSFPLRRCSPFVTGSYHGSFQPEQTAAAAGQVRHSFAVNGENRATAGFSTNADVLGADSLTLTDGLCPGRTAAVGTGDNASHQKEKHVQPKGKKKKSKRRGRVYHIHN